jgi:arsenate reductase
MTITIYHNPKCSNSRGALERIRAAGHEPRIVEYLTAPPTRDELKALLRKMGMSVRELVRTKEAVYSELGLERASDEALLAAMLAHPILINRPIVVAGERAVLARPPERVDELL